MALIVDGSGTGYLRTVCDYVHLNAVGAKLLRKEDVLRAYQWSTASAAGNDDDPGLDSRLEVSVLSIGKFGATSWSAGYGEKTEGGI
jgi:hypothetical protein